ncbi:MAG: 30S ribosomal protein THX [Gammaproteobacteria bacterium]|nr:30S ribosomal protein THX [Gammaproteobacteria bacterium]
MGKGDQRTRRGKIVRGTFGVRRPKKRKRSERQDERRGR